MDISYTYNLENVLGTSTSRIHSGFTCTQYVPGIFQGDHLIDLENPNNTLEPAEIGSLNIELTSKTVPAHVCLPLGPCLVTWVCSDDQSSLLRQSLHRLHHDAITYISPLSETFAPSSSLCGESDIHPHFENQSTDFSQFSSGNNKNIFNRQKNLLVSASFKGEVAIWDPHSLDLRLKTPLVRWKVNSTFPDRNHLDFPVNCCSWNPKLQRLATISASKNPNLPPRPLDDIISPDIPTTTNICVWDLQPILSQDYKQDPNLQPTLSFSTEVQVNGRVYIAWNCITHPESGEDVHYLIAAYLESKSKHQLVVFSEHSPNPLCTVDIHGSSIFSFLASPKGDCVLISKGNTMYIYKILLVKDEASGVYSVRLSQSASLDLETLSLKSPSPAFWVDSQIFGFTSLGNIVYLKWESSENYSRLELLAKYPFYTIPNPFSIFHAKYNTNDNRSKVVTHSIWSVSPDAISCTIHQLTPEEVKLTPHLILTKYDSSRFKNITLEVAKITCCGTDIDPSGRFIAVGDWQGVTVWDKHSTFPRARWYKYGFSVRSLRWSPENSTIPTLFIGDTKGRLYQWNLNLNISLIQNPECKPKKIKRDGIHRSINAIQKSEDLIAFGDSNGYLHIHKKSLSKEGHDCDISQSSNNNNSPTEWNLELQFQSHLQQPHVSSNEIWTLAFSPCRRWIATGGEDHTVRIYYGNFNDLNSYLDDNKRDFANRKLVCILAGPAAAVTCIDWQLTANGSILIVSSDDRTVHVWKLCDSSLNSNGENVIVSNPLCLVPPNFDFEIYNPQFLHSQENVFNTVFRDHMKAQATPDGCPQPMFELVGKIRTQWHDLMITYISLEKYGSRFACTTMSGYLYVYSLPLNLEESIHQLPLVRSKVHLGSLEGLAWLHNSTPPLLAVCSGDCSASVITL